MLRIVVDAASGSHIKAIASIQGKSPLCVCYSADLFVKHLLLCCGYTQIGRSLCWASKTQPSQAMKPDKKRAQSLPCALLQRCKCLKTTTLKNLYSTQHRANTESGRCIEYNILNFYPTTPLKPLRNHWYCTETCVFEIHMTGAKRKHEFISPKNHHAKYNTEALQRRS